MPLFDPSTTKHLKPWLIKSLEPICDADPEVLSDYILALLKHDAPEKELRATFVAQLRDFLEDEAESFVEKLFQVLRTRSYIPYDDGQPPPSSHLASQSNGIHIPLDALVTAPTGPRGQKRTADFDEPRHPPKGPRLGEGTRYVGRGGGSLRGGPRDARGRHSSPGRTKGPVKERCRDYYNKGYCTLGAMCPFDHGDEAMVPPVPFVPPGFNPIQMMGMMQQGFQMPWMSAPNVGGQYDPNHASMDISRPPPYMNGRRSSKIGTPSDAVELSIDTAGDGRHSMDVTPSDPGGRRPNTNGSDLGRGGRGRGRIERGGAPPQPGVFPDAENTTFESSAPPLSKNENKTLVVEKIPPDHLSLDGVNGWFKKFGVVTNVAIDKPSAKALVSFQNHLDAYKAWKSEEAVFGNRFVKVFWHRPLAGHGTAGTKLLAASAPVIQGLGKKPPHPPPTQTMPPTSSHLPQHLAKSHELERLISEQKSLMDSIGSAPQEKRKGIMATLREVDEKMKELASSKPTPIPPVPDSESKLKEKLDRELDLVKNSSGPSDTTIEGTGGDQSDLMAQLAELRKEAAEVGVSAKEIQGVPPPRGRGFVTRGRGRGRGYVAPRGRGGTLNKNISLDNRTRRLVVKGLNADDDHALAKLEEWYKSVGGDLESFQVVSSDEVQVQFKTRALAEQALGKGTTVPDIGTVQVSWHHTSRSTPAPPVPSTGIPALLNLSKSDPELIITPAEEDIESAKTVIPEPHDVDHFDDGWGADQFND
ncbi:uncharacterized protein EI90DRAFT_3292861 [Cantharellus anzutake]|uniref:uncharacterized protein n=1 Tax=Cantharellus anzutake TaxID=1750568 RepID=UPI00190397F4|nr:uncharacterized protein EI90DRAFT_3292861 [Cantharellus anzutake]KAF8320567.1 hypothetical protein EI90DRAFT_3292861 [Cantharellus anzutake]